MNAFFIHSVFDSLNQDIVVEKSKLSLGKS